MKNIISILKVLCALEKGDIGYLENFKEPLNSLIQWHRESNISVGDLLATLERVYPATKKSSERGGTSIAQELVRIVKNNINNPEFLKYFEDGSKSDSTYVEQNEFELAQKLEKLAFLFKEIYQIKDLAQQEQKIQELTYIVSTIRGTVENLINVNKNGKIIKFV